MAKKSSQAAHEAAKKLEIEIVQFKNGDNSIPFNVDLTAETVWATQQQIADLYERDKRTISEHIQAILAEGELEEKSTVRKFRTVASNGKPYDILHYDLDMILAVGFRVKSPKATQFRKWAYQILRSYLVDGYALNEARLRDDPNALRRLAAKIRQLRADEKNIYANVRECFKVSSSDYDKDSKVSVSFYAKLQNKFLYAVTQKTASEIVLNRANHRLPFMGIQARRGDDITLDETKISKNYLDQDELYTLHLLCEQFLLFAESKALRGQKLTMKELEKKLDSLLQVNEYPVFKEYKDYLRTRAIQHATAEYALYRRQIAKAKEKPAPPK